MGPSAPGDEVVTEGEQMSLLIVDDHEVVREGLAAALGRDGRFDVVGAASTGRDAVRLARRLRPDVAIIDLRLPDVAGDVLCRQLRTALPGVAVIVLSSYLTEEAVRNAVRAGASAYVTKAAGLPELRAALDETWARRGRPDDVRCVSQIVRRLEQLVEARCDGIAPTPQQARVLELAAKGLTYSEIAKRLVVSESTVRFHIQKLKVKFETSSKTELVVRAIRAGLIAAPGDEATG